MSMEQLILFRPQTPGVTDCWLLFLLRLQLRVINPTCGAQTGVGGNREASLETNCRSSECALLQTDAETIMREKKESMQRTKTGLQTDTRSSSGLKRLAKTLMHALRLTPYFVMRARAFLLMHEIVSCLETLREKNHKLVTPHCTGPWATNNYCCCWIQQQRHHAQKSCCYSLLT